MEPLVVLLHTPGVKWNLTDTRAGAGSAFVIGAHWSHTLLHRHGYANDSTCCCCGETPGMLAHRELSMLSS